LERSLKLDSSDPKVALDLARQLAMLGRYEPALLVLDQASGHEDALNEILGEKAAILVQSGEYNRAFDEYGKLQQRTRSYDNAIVMAKLAARFDRCRDVVDVLAPFQREFQTADPFLLLGECLLKNQQPAQAETLFRRSLMLDPECFDCSLKLGDALFETERWAEAAEQYEHAARLNPRDPRAFVQAGKSWGNAAQHLRAAQALASASERSPKDPEILFLWGLEALRGGERGMAWKVLGELNAVDKDLGRRLERELRQNPISD
jgi:tetratricopeptide (TPR) repeat protein